MILSAALGVADEIRKAKALRPLPLPVKPATVDKAMIAADPAAAFVGYLSTILAVFGFFDWVGLNADQVAILGGAVLGLMATIRVFYEKARRVAHEELSRAHEELKRQTASKLKKEDFVESPSTSDVVPKP